MQIFDDYLANLQVMNEFFFYSVYHLYQGMYKNRVENDRKFYEIQHKTEQEN